MLGATTTVIRESSPVHWEAVLITAVPATLALLGTIVTALLGRRNKQHLTAIDEAVNGVESEQPTLREKVEAIADTVAPVGEPSLREKVDAIQEKVEPAS